MNITTLLSIITLILTLGLAFAVLYNIKLSVLFFQQTNKNFRNFVQFKNITLSPSTESMVELAVEVWRLEKRVSKVSKDLSEDQNKAFENSITKLNRYLEKNDITFTDYTDQKYNEGLNLDVLSIEKDKSITDSIIKETREPAVFHMRQLIKKAKVVVHEK